MKKVIIIGATSGIGRGLAELFVSNGATVGIIGRRESLLKEIHSQNEEKYIYKVGDITNTNDIKEVLNELYTELGGLDLFIISAGTGDLNPQLDYHLEEPAINTNVLGFTSVLNWGYKIFETQKRGHLVTISSLAGIRGSGIAPAYNASKSYQMNYVEGLKQKTSKLHLPIYITDVRPGFVDTAMAKGEGLFWVVPIDKAVRQIYKGIAKKEKTIYVSKRWKIVAMLLRIIPSAIYCRM